jgi:hypothetical protein
MSPSSLNVSAIPLLFGDHVIADRLDAVRIGVARASVGSRWGNQGPCVQDGQRDHLGPEADGRRSQMIS